MKQGVNFDFQAMRAVDIRTVDPTELTDIRDIEVNSALPKRERILDFIRQVKNPYCYKCGKMVVKVSFAETEATLEDKLESYLLSL